MRADVYNQKGEKVGTAELSDRVFGVKWNPDLVHQVVTSQAANRRVPIAHAKTRGEVRGGGKKPWRQKGTGRARHGSIRSPIWAGGGVTHGPRADKSYKKKINKAMAKRALHAVLSAKANAKEVVVLDSLEFPERKTKIAALMFLRLSKLPALSNIMKGNGVLLAVEKKNGDIIRSVRNLPYASVFEARNLNAYDILRYKYILFPKGAIEKVF